MLTQVASHDADFNVGKSVPNRRVGADTFFAMLLSRRPLLRDDDPMTGTRALLDLEAKVRYVLEDDEVCRSASL